MKVNAREAPVLAGALELLRLRGFPAWRMNSGGLRTPSGGFIRFGFAGCPDILAVAPGGRLMMVECKAPGGKPTEAQLATLNAIRDAGGVALLIDGLGKLDHALATLKAWPWAVLTLEGERED